MNENAVGTILVDCAVSLHRDLGPGLLESVYEVTLSRALERRGLRVRRQVGIAIEYDGERLDEGFRADLVIEEMVIVELKSVEQVTRAHKKQVLTYLRLSGLKLGYLLNFGAALMCDGITRLIQGQLEPASPCLSGSVRGVLQNSDGSWTRVPTDGQRISVKAHHVPFRLRDESFRGNGVLPGVREGEWRAATE